MKVNPYRSAAKQIETILRYVHSHILKLLNIPLTPEKEILEAMWINQWPQPSPIVTT
jgi:hypothetical protein